MQSATIPMLHYLMKPVKEEKLCSVLDRATEKLVRNEKVLNLGRAEKWCACRSIKSGMRMCLVTM